MKRSVRFLLNDSARELTLPPALTVLDALRKHLGLFGTKEGCREGECGACTVVVGELKNGGLSYRAVPSCLLPVAELEGRHLVTIEGLGLEDAADNAVKDAPFLNPIQQAFVDEGASQCGFCTPGFIMSLTGYFLSGGPLTAEGALTSIDGNICRCTGYASIRRAVESLIKKLDFEDRQPDLRKLAELKVIPPYFTKVKAKLSALRETGAIHGEKGAYTRENDPSVPEGRLTRSESPVVLAGGTDIYIQRGDELTEREVTLVSSMDGLDIMEESGDSVIIGAGVTVEDFRKNKLLNAWFPGLDEKMLLVSSTIIRNRATLGGNIVNASPIADMAVLLLAMKSRIALSGPSGSRTFKLKDFFLSYKKLDLRVGEIVKALEIPKPSSGSLWNFEKVSRRRRLDIAACNSAVTLSLKSGVMKGVSLAFGGVAPVPLYASGTSEFLSGKKVDTGTVREAAGILRKELSPIADVRGASGYKGELAVRQLYAHFLLFFPENLSFAGLIGDFSGDGGSGKGGKP